VSDEKIPDVYEDRHTRDPEWAELQDGGGNQAHRLRKFMWDHISDEIEVTGPVIDVNPPVRPA